MTGRRRLRFEGNGSEDAVPVRADSTGVVASPPLESDSGQRKAQTEDKDAGGGGVK